MLAVAASVSAQSGSVTLYGLMDLGVGDFKSPGSGVNGLNPRNKQVVNGAMSTSYFGLRGAEDLGGGLSATFELSSFIRASTGAVGRSDAIGRRRAAPCRRARPTT